MISCEPAMEYDTGSYPIFDHFAGERIDKRRGTAISIDTPTRSAAFAARSGAIEKVTSDHFAWCRGMATLWYLWLPSRSHPDHDKRGWHWGMMIIEIYRLGKYCYFPATDITYHPIYDVLSQVNNTLSSCRNCYFCPDHSWFILSGLSKHWVW